MAMRIRSDRISFTLPDGFEDETIYEFRNESRMEALMVTCGILPPEANDLASLVTARRAEIERSLIALTGRFFTDEQRTQLGNLPCYVLTYIFECEEKQMGSRIALSVLDAQSYIELNYIAPETHDLYLTFNHIIQSVSLLKDGTQRSNPPKGYVRRQANCICLDVPEYLQPPSTYHFNSHEKRIRLQLTLWDDCQDTKSIPSIEEEITNNTRYGADISQQGICTIQTHHGEIVIIDYIDQLNELPEELRNEVVRYARFKLGNDVWITVIGRSSIDNFEIMKQEFVNFINNINMEVTSWEMN
jgi:hypothetical protein